MLRQLPPFLQGPPGPLQDGRALCHPVGVLKGVQREGELGLGGVVCAPDSGNVGCRAPLASPPPPVSSHLWYPRYSLARPQAALASFHMLIVALHS